MKIKKKRAIILMPAAIGLLLAASNAQAGIMYSGSISNIGTDTSMVGTESWSSGSSLSWDVSFDDTTSRWTYDYTLGVEKKDISHFILGLCPPLDANDFFSIAGSHNGKESFGTFGSQGKSNPGIPSDLYGLKIDISGDTENLTFTLVTEAAPGWGDFYAKDGKDGGNDVYMHNSGFLISNPTDPVADGSLNGHILIPCGTSAIPPLTPVPEPSSALGLAFLLLAGFSTRRRC